MAGAGYLNFHLHCGHSAVGPAGINRRPNPPIRRANRGDPCGPRQSSGGTHQHQSQQGGPHRASPHAFWATLLRRRASPARMSRCRTTSTTPACRWRTWWWDSSTWKREPWRKLIHVDDGAGIPRRAFRLLLCKLRARLPALRGRQGGPGMARPGPKDVEEGHGETAAMAEVDAHRPHPPGKHAAPEHRV